MRNKSGWLILGMVALVMVAMLATAVSGPVQVQAAPAAAPTPVSASAAVFANVLNFGTQRMTADGTVGSVLTLGNAQRVDLQHVVDMRTVNTTTLKLQFSNDGTNWVDGATFGTAVAADANAMQQYAVFGRYARVYADVINSNPLTITVIGVGK